MNFRVDRLLHCLIQFFRHCEHSVNAGEGLEVGQVVEVIWRNGRERIAFRYEAAATDGQ